MRTESLSAYARPPLLSRWKIPGETRDQTGQDRTGQPLKLDWSLPVLPMQIIVSPDRRRCDLQLTHDSATINPSFPGQTIVPDLFLAGEPLIYQIPSPNSYSYSSRILGCTLPSRSPRNARLRAARAKWSRTNLDSVSCFHWHQGLEAKGTRHQMNDS